ncbi:MAG: hypothetical protein JW902_18425 [Syntrophaceae bacterium]|nr:hypothetical protein [Syntrophaceae bacterium]
MSKIPRKPEEIFPEITEQMKMAFGEELKSISLYGSGASHEYIPGRSDLNFLVVVSDEGLTHIQRLQAYVKEWRKKRVATPLVMTKAFLESALDVYPIEFLTMQYHHVQVYGEDILSSLLFDRKDMRLQLEREIKGKLIHLRQGYLESQEQAKVLRDLIKVSLVAFLSMFAAVLYLKGKTVPQERRRLIREACELVGIDGGVFLMCLDIKEDAVKYDLKEVVPLFEKYRREIEKFDHVVDRLMLEAI